MIGKIQSSNINFKAFYVREDENMQAAKVTMKKIGVLSRFDDAVKKMREKLEGDEVNITLAASKKYLLDHDENIDLKLLIGNEEQSLMQEVGNTHHMLVDEGYKGMLKRGSDFLFEKMLKDIDFLKKFVIRMKTNQ